MSTDLERHIIKTIEALQRDLASLLMVEGADVKTTSHLISALDCLRMMRENVRDAFRQR